VIVEPKIRNNICLTAHPGGCARQVEEQIEFVRSRIHELGGNHRPTRALVVGSSNGYGLAARILAAYGYGAASVGVAFERPGGSIAAGGSGAAGGPGGEGRDRLGTAGWHNDKAFLAAAARDLLGAWSINGDAFSAEVKDQAVELIRDRMGPIDLLVYSIASPRRLDPLTGTLHSSVIKPIGSTYVSRSLDFLSGKVSDFRADPVSSDQEIEDTVKVMGGEDWRLWVERLRDEGLLADGVTAVAFSYIGPAYTAPIYRDGTIGRAKEHLEATARQLNDSLSARGGRALVSVNKALVTRASAVIPAVPLYIAILYKVMKEKGLHEVCINQMHRLFRDYLYADRPLPVDAEGRVRLDDWEMRADVQGEVARRWEQAETANIQKLADVEGFRAEYLNYHGFGVAGIDYAAEVDP
jgi:enoyl-[acyl-carrier protein] reductase / trans-2-enoyl-CoA reductase (NAD+)